MTTKLSLPDIPRAKIYLPNGTMSKVWQKYFKKLFDRVGRHDELSNTELADIINHDDLVASRILSTNAEKVFESIEDLTVWIQETSKQVIVTDNGDGTLTLSLPQDIDTDSDVVFGSIGFGDPEVDGSYRIIPDGDNLNFERREAGVWVRKGDVRP